MMQVFHKLQEAWILKVCLSCAVTVAIHEHAQIFTAFVALVFVDLFSKWLSLSRQRLVDHGEQSPNLWKALCGLRAARHDGYIRSDAMRTRFVHKILGYVVVVASAVVLDFMLTHRTRPPLRRLSSSATLRSPSLYPSWKICKNRESRKRAHWSISSASAAASRPTRSRRLKGETTNENIFEPRARPCP